MRRVLEWSLRIFIKWLQCLYEMLCILPVLLLLGVLIVPERYRLLSFCYLAGGYLLGLLLGLPLKKSRMWLRLLLTLAGAVAPACYLFPPENWAPIATAIGIVTVYRGSALTHKSWEEHYPLPVSWIGLVLYLIFSYLFTRGNMLVPYLPLYTLAGSVFIIATVFALNHRAMEKAMPAQGGVIPLPVRMIKQNRWLIALMTVVVLVIGLFREIEEAVVTAAAAVVDWFLGVLEAVYGSMRQVTLEQGTMPLLPEEGTANPFWEKVLTILLYIVAGAIGLFMIGVLSVMVWKGLRRLFRALRELLGRRGESVEQGYIDKRESLWDMGRMARRTLARTRKWLRSRFTPRERWADMSDNRQRVRFLYRRYIRRAMAAGFHPDPAATAAEALAAAQGYAGDGSLPDALAGLYTAARYGDVQPTDADIATVRDILDH